MGPHNLPKVARLSGISESKLRALCHGRRHILAEDLRRIYTATKDVGLFAELSGARDLGLEVSESSAQDPGEQSARSGALKVSSDAGKVAELVDEAEADGVITETERRDIEQQIEQLEGKAASLRLTLRARSMKVVGSKR